MASPTCHYSLRGERAISAGASQWCMLAVREGSMFSWGSNLPQYLRKWHSSLQVMRAAFPSRCCMGSVHLNNTSRRGRKWNTNVASAIHSQCRECRIRSKVDDTIKEMTIHGDVWSTIQNYWMFGKKPFDVAHRLLRETNGSGIFHHEIVFQIFIRSLYFLLYGFLVF